MTNLQFNILVIIVIPYYHGVNLIIPSLHKHIFNL